MATNETIERLVNRVTSLENALRQVVEGVSLDGFNYDDNGLQSIIDRSDDKYTRHELRKLDAIARDVLYIEEPEPVEQGPTRADEINLARTIDPFCWQSYSGMPKEYKRYMDQRRTKSIAEAEKRLRSD